MDTEFIISVWGAGLSTILGIITVLQYKKQTQIKLSIIGTADKPFEHLRISICNIGTKPVTLTGYHLGIGSDKNNQELLIKDSFEVERKLSESDIYTFVINRDTIQYNYKELQTKQTHFRRLWINITLSSGKSFSDTVYINPEIISKKYYQKAEQYIATDVFIGLPQIESEIFPIGFK